MQKISLRFDAVEAAIASLKADFNYVRHIMIDKINDLRLFREEVFKKLDETMEVCTRMDTRLDKIQSLDSLTMESNVKQALASFIRSLAINNATPHYATKKRTFAEIEPAFHSALARGVVSSREINILYYVLPLPLILLDHALL